MERSHSSPLNTEVVPVSSRVACGATLSQIAKAVSPPGTQAPPTTYLVLSRKIADLVEVTDVNWNRNVGRVAVVEEMLEMDLHGNGTNEFAEARRLEIFHAPDFQHERAEVFADEGHLAIIQIYGVKV